jgi:RTX calcium-binding nonapeptide repeat (4 copies)/Domain of unknown function (DUF5122) beta-propeller
MPARKGRLVLIGAFDNKTFATRFLLDGSSDRRFGKRGLTWPRLPLPRRRFVGSAIDGVGRILFATVTNRSRGEFGLARLRSNGSLDLTFAGGDAGGIPSIARAQSVALQSNGRIIVLGEGGACERTCPPSRMVIARYFGGNSRARCNGRRANVVGTRRSETLEATSRSDVIQALGGDDRILGFAGNDLICGGKGDDRLFGGTGRDRLLGGAGGDRTHQ